MSDRNGAVKTCEMTERFLLPSQPCPLEQVLKSLSSGETYKIQKKVLVSAQQPRDHISVWGISTSASCLNKQSQNTKEAGAGKKEALPPKSPTPRLVGSVRNVRCCLTIDGF